MSNEVSSTVENWNCDGGDGEFASAEELESLYIMLENGVIPELSWHGEKSFASRQKTVTVEQNAVADSTETQEPVKNDFDFSDEVTPTQMRQKNATPKSTKKKMANFADVMVLQKKKNAEGAKT